MNAIHQVRLLVIVALLYASSSLQAAEPQGEALRKTIDDEHAIGLEGWVYNNIPKAMAEARRQNKPLFVTFRCVPCNDCKGFDAEVAQGSDVIAKLAKEKFVAVRQVEMKGVDLSLFQFDHDLNWAAMFVHPDGVVYARYGTQSAEGADAYNSIEGLENTMERVLKLHENYDQVKESLAGKHPGEKPYKTAMEMPALAHKATYLEMTTRKNCIHCHNIHDAEQEHAYDTGTFSQEMLWRYPLPDNIGLSIDGDDGIRIQEIADRSPAEAAGLEAGEDVVSMNGQPMTSIADMQWVLHHLPNEETTVQVTGSKTGEHSVELKAGWKKSDISWRASLYSVRPRLNVWMPPLPDDLRQRNKLGEDEAALLAKWINRGQPGGKAAFDAGLREGDIIIAIDGQPLPKQTPPELQMHIKLNYEVGDVLPMTVLRNGKKKELRIPLTK